MVVKKKYNIIIPKSLTVDSNSLKKLYLNYFENPFRKLKEKGILYSIDENGGKLGRLTTNKVCIPH